MGTATTSHKPRAFRAGKVPEGEGTEGSGSREGGRERREKAGGQSEGVLDLFCQFCVSSGSHGVSFSLRVDGDVRKAQRLRRRMSMRKREYCA